MKKAMSRKILSAVMALTMLFSLTTTAAAAESTLTRAELAVKLVETAGLAGEVSKYAAQPSAYSDVPDGSTYEGYINLASAKGLLKGTGDGKFSPNAKASQVQAAVTVMRYVGLPCDVLTTWPEDCSYMAAKAGITSGVSYSASAGVTAAQLSKMLSNAGSLLGKPIIGISWENPDQEEDYEDWYKIIAKAGGVAVELPQITSASDARAVVASVGGLVVTGGEDINPDLYNEPHDPLLEDNNEIRDLRDTSDYNLIQAAVTADLPMLAICRGCQMFNVAMGGGLIQDLPTYLGTTGDQYTTHRIPAGTPNRDYARHDITIDNTSKWLKGIVGAYSMENVPSWHHQVLNPARIGQGLTVVAYGPENVVEAVEYKANRFALGIQFHPERDALGEDAYSDVEICMNFFETLVDYASDKPVIGISWENPDQAEDYADWYKIIDQAGGIAQELPQITSYAEAQAAVASVDGIIVTGGEDINPDLYNEPHDPLLEDNTEIRDLRDTSDYNLIKAAVAADEPMLAICRGCQMFNVAMGGGLIQDLPTYLGTTGDQYTTHRIPAGTPNRDYARHGVMVESGSKWLETIIGATTLDNAPSWHHQVLNPARIGQGLTVVAYGPENVVEAVEYQANTFALGIQFHPERDALGENASCDVPTCMRFFETLVDYAGK